MISIVKSSVRRTTFLARSFAIALAIPDLCSAAELCVNPGGTGGCFSSIQAAVDAAFSGDEIDVEAGIYVESPLILEKNLTITGAGVTATTVEGSIVVEGGPRSPGTRIADLRVQNGTSYGITSQIGAHVVVDGCVVSNNSPGGLLIYRTGFVGARVTSMIVNESTVSGNSGAGAGIVSRSGSATVIRSVISGNTTTNVEGGGGIYVDLKGGRIAIEDSTVSGNSAPRGGGVGVLPGGKFSAKRSTIAGNSATGVGGGIFAWRDGDPGSGGGPGAVKLEASIVADNTASAGPDCAVAANPPLGSRGYNLIQSVADCVSRSRPTDIIGQAPLLGPLQDNGGPTETRALLPGSPAIGTVTKTKLCSEPDQRGVPRSVPCDSGAYEAP